MTRLLAVVVAGAFALGCQEKGDTTWIASEEEDDAAYDIAPDARDAPGTLPAHEDDEAAAAPAVQTKDEDRTPGLEVDPEAAPAAEGARVERAVPRDLGAELNAAVGSLEDCVQNPQPARTTVVRIDATATIRPSGVVIHPSATGVGLSQAERQCVARRVGAAVLAPLSGDVSQRTTTVFEIELRPPTEPSTYRVGTPDPQLRNVREPLPPRPEVAPSGRTIQEPTSRPIQDPSSRPVQEPNSRKVRGPQPRPIDGFETDESSKDWR